MKGQGWGQTLGLTPVGWFGFIEGLYDVVPNVEMRSRSPADVVGGWVRCDDEKTARNISILCRMSKSSE